jgi:Rieske 2Fe-2S family protein
MSTEQLERTLPTSWYLSSAVFQAEKERIFCREWIGVCREEELQNPGDSLVLDLLGESILVVRNREGQLRAFYNVCRHRGSRLCRATDEPVATSHLPEDSRPEE